MSDEMVEERRAALEVLQQADNVLELPLAQFGYAFALLWNGRTEEAAVQFRAALLLARQTGIVLVETQCLTYLALIARLRGEVDEARDLTLLALDSAQTSQRLDYVGIAQANQAWLAWRSGNLSAARRLAEKALEAWEEAATGIPFRWLALWPLIGVALEAQMLELALTYARELLHDSQQPPPPHVRERVSAALAVWEAGYGVQARAHLNAAAGAAAVLGYL
jgi:tetratricopeptide (TPR) repeat protein